MVKNISYHSKGHNLILLIRVGHFEKKQPVLSLLTREYLLKTIAELFSSDLSPDTVNKCHRAHYDYLDKTLSIFL